MSDSITQFYDDMAADYHLIFANWAQSVQRQGAVLDNLIRSQGIVSDMIEVLDCACGIGTQAIGLALQGQYKVHATDISAQEVERAKKESANMGVSLTFDVADMRMLSQNIKTQFPVVISFDNSIPHLLTDDELNQAANELYTVTAPGGILLASIRDYDALLGERPTFTSERIMESQEGRRITFQIWDWEEEHYTVTQFILVPLAEGWQTRTYTTRYRALRRSVLGDALLRAGFAEVQWLTPEQSGFYQPVVIARKA